jgi:hypothetical protein
MSLLKKIQGKFNPSKLISLLFIINVVACGECSNAPISQTYGDLVMSVNKQELTGEEDQKKFVLSFLKKDKELYTLLENFELNVSVAQGEVSYLAYENEKWIKKTGANFTKNLTHFFNFFKLGGEDVDSQKGDISFTIKPDSNSVQTTVILELFKIDGETREQTSGPLSVIWNKAESDISLCFEQFFGLVNNEFRNDEEVTILIGKSKNDAINLEDIFIRLTSTAGDKQGANFTLNDKKVISGELKNIEPFLLTSRTTRKNDNTFPRCTILKLDEENDKSTSEVTIEIICGVKKIVKNLTWSKAILPTQPHPTTEGDDELKKEGVVRKAVERLRQEEEQRQEENELKKVERLRQQEEERLQQEEERLQQEKERLQQEKERLQQEKERLQQEEERLQQEEERLQQKEAELRQAEEAERVSKAAEQERLRQEESRLRQAKAERLANAAEADPNVEGNAILGGNDSTSTSTSDSSIQLASSASMVPPAPTPPPASLVSTFPTQQKPASTGDSRPIAREDKRRERLDLQDKPTSEQLLSQTRKNLKPASEQRQSQQVSDKTLSPNPPAIEEIARQKRRSVMMDEGELEETEEDERERNNKEEEEYRQEEAQKEKLRQEENNKLQQERAALSSTAKRIVIPRRQVTEGVRTALLDAIKNRANQATAVNSGERASLLLDIHKDIDKGLFKPRFTLRPSLPSVGESPNDIQKVLAAGFDKMIAKVQTSSDENEGEEMNNDEIDPWDDDEATIEKEISDWYEIGHATQSSLNPTFKAKLKRLRQIYRKALKIDLDKDRAWDWEQWLIWEYKNYNNPDQKAKIEAEVDNYIERKADKLQQKYGNLDISNPIRVEKDRKDVVLYQDMERTIIPPNQ